LQWLLACGWSVATDVIVTTGGGTAVSSVDEADPSNSGISTMGEAPPSDCIAAWVGGAPTLTTPALLANVNTRELEADPRVFDEGRGLTFASIGEGRSDYDLYVSRRAALNEPFPVATPIETLNSGFDDTAVTALDREILYFASNRSTQGKRSTLWQATLDVRLIELRELVELSELGVTGNNFDPFVSTDGQWLYWTNDSDNTKNLRIARRQDVDGTFVEVGIAPFESNAYDDSLSLTDDDRVAVFSSEREGGSGKQDLWFATREETDLAFSTPSPVPSLNSVDVEREAFISANGCALYFVSDRPGGPGEWDIYVSHVVVE
jgi:hypothetical protein